ncbi:hypothetical protein RCH18_001189 [Flavobacterium sp. PL11]|uniref:hypothetical protein n=1 Tax=Flavobacterium sp. PL11 TaxID=3071717 RepID=UPI002DFB450E|nr:hypothetical protein [Flavobacterium sp. PL11]
MERNTKQFLIPEKKNTIANVAYDIYPSHHIAQGKIESGYESLANELISKKIIILDGYIGVDWDEIRHSLAKQFDKDEKSYEFIDVKKYLITEMEIEKIIEPFLGGDDPIFGFRTTLSLQDYFDLENINDIDLNSNIDLHIIYGTGASQSNIKGFLVYFDLPKSEIQYRMRFGGITNLGFANPKEVKQMYKQFFFIDWIILKQYLGIFDQQLTGTHYNSRSLLLLEPTNVFQR